MERGSPILGEAARRHLVARARRECSLRTVSDWTELGRPAWVISLRMEWDQAPDEDEAGFLLVLGLKRSDDSSVEAKFANVTAFRFEQPHGLVVLQVDDHRPDGWESRSQLGVWDSEHDEALSFYCSSATII